MRSKAIRPSLTLQQLLAEHLPAYQHRFNGHQLRVLNALKQCKTPALGGHKSQCSQCGHTHVFYNSCANRHCPGCQGVNRERWLIERDHDLFDVPYHHVVFTVPAALREVFYHNQSLLYNVLFASMWETLLSFSKDKRSKLEAQIGVIAILHTWTQQLAYHPHLHCIVPNGGFKAGRWKEGKKNFLFAVKALSEVYKHKFCARLRALYQKEQLDSKLSPYDFDRWVSQLAKLNWVVYSKPGFNGKASVLEYLGRYTHRIALSNYRLERCEDEQVTFRYRDRKAGDVVKKKTLPVGEFLERFGYHILPRQFVKIRSYGLFSNRNKKQLLPKVFGALKQHQATKQKLSAREVIYTTTGKDIARCPRCKKGEMMVVEEILPANRGSPHILGQWLRTKTLATWR